MIHLNKIMLQYKSIVGPLRGLIVFIKKDFYDEKVYFIKFFIIFPHLPLSPRFVTGLVINVFAIRRTSVNSRKRRICTQRRRQ